MTLQLPPEGWDHNTRWALAKTFGSTRKGSIQNRQLRGKKKKKNNEHEGKRIGGKGQFRDGSLAEERQQQSQMHHRESKEKSRYSMKFMRGGREQEEIK